MHACMYMYTCTYWALESLHVVGVENHNSASTKEIPHGILSLLSFVPQDVVLPDNSILFELLKSLMPIAAWPNIVEHHTTQQKSRFEFPGVSSQVIFGLPSFAYSAWCLTTFWGNLHVDFVLKPKTLEYTMFYDHIFGL